MSDNESGRPDLAGLRGPRYDLGEVLGRGANGVVHLAGDRRLGRTVALKLLNAEKEKRDKEALRFTHEAQVTGQLAHPSIVPVHDLGTLPDGRLYYTMKRIQGRSLREIFVDLKKRDPASQQRWTETHFVSTLLRVAQALAFSHDRGIVHRDVKPANIMVGEYGEVLLLDWGVARVLGVMQPVAVEGEDTPPRRVVTWRSLSDQDPTIDGTVAGTPAYMPPEQARGDIEAIGPWSDVYSVGVILYEFLVGARPIRGRTVEELLQRVISHPILPPSQRNPDGRVDPELEDLVMRCLAKNRARRPRSGTELAQELERFLEGSRRREEAHELSRRGLARSAAYTKAAEATAVAETSSRELASATPPWADDRSRRNVWETESRYRALRRLRDDTYDESLALLQAAVERDPDLLDARDGLAALYLRRMDEAEARGEVEATRFFRAQVLRYDTGRLASVLEGESSLSVNSLPVGRPVTLHRLVEWERGTGMDEGRYLGTTPLNEIPLQPGGYVVRVPFEGRDDVLAPVHADRPGPHSVIAAPPKTLLPGFVYIPSGAFVRGGDPGALDAFDRDIRDLGAFAIARHPVTLGEFQRFLREGGEAAGYASWVGPDGISEADRSRLPALGVTFDAARAYAVWASERTGRTLRLPSHDEWEKAARGVDARVFPWGGPWEPSFCNGVDALPGEPRPEPVGSRPRDASIYGVADLAGGVHEWVLGDVPHRPDRRWVRGGSWNGHPRAARICSRLMQPATSRGGTLGMRLVQEL
ncbi:MAG: SUMF1/EgtB/PvdO family nonheme iron enzyme [Deltaproteobacteria bacterium]|nr:SUMF1/EgtB/PvdO family nonheme iron enzyme [Deltaproteobacteria bacterium]